MDSEENMTVQRILLYVNNQLNNMNYLELTEIAEHLDINSLFVCIDRSNNTQILKISLKILKKLFLVLPPQYVFNKYAANIVQSLHHPENVVKFALLKQIDKLLFLDNNIGLQLELVFAILDCFSSTDELLVSRATLCFMRFQSKQILSSIPILSKFRIITGSYSDVGSCLGVYSVLINWSKSKDVLAMIVAEDLFSSLKTNIINTNILMRVKIIKELKGLMKTDHGFEYLISSGILNGLYECLNLSEYQPEDTSMRSVYSAVLEIFKEIALLKPHLIYELCPMFFVVICKILNEKDALVNEAMNIVDKLATSWDCKIALDIPAPKLMIDEYKGKGELNIWSLFIEKLNNIASGTTITQREQAIKTITKIFTVETGTRFSKDIMLKLTQKWYKQLSFENIVYRQCNVPLLKIQIAGFELLLNLSNLPWGQEEINKYPSIIDLVLVPPHEHEALAIEILRQKIVETLLASETSREILDKDIILRIHNFYYTLQREGTIINLRDSNHLSM